MKKAIVFILTLILMIGILPLNSVALANNDMPCYCNRRADRFCCEFDHVGRVALTGEHFQFEVEINGETAAARTFRVPTRGGNAAAGLGMNWRICWGNGTAAMTFNRFTVANDDSVFYAYPANGTYTITITPGSSYTEQWLVPFGAGSIAANQASLNMIRRVFSPLTPLMHRAPVQFTGSGGGLFSERQEFVSWFRNMPNMTMGQNFTFCPEHWSGVPMIRNSFANNMFMGSTSVTMNEIFNLPQGITTVGTVFASNMFRGATNLKMNEVFNLPPNITSVGVQFANGMFAETSVVMNEIFNLPQGITTVGDSFAVGMFMWARNDVRMNDVFNLPPNITGAVGGSFAANMFRGVNNLKMNEVFNLPPNITSVGSNFAGSMFMDSTSVTMNEIFNLPQGITTVGDNFAVSMFMDSTSATMNEIFNLPPNITGAVGGGFAANMFRGVNNLKMNEVFNLPPNITSVGSNFAGSMFMDSTSVTMNEIFNLPQGITTLGVNATGFAERMFLNAEGIEINEVFTFPVLNQTGINRADAFLSTFAGASLKTENRTAISIINGNPLPNTNRTTFSNAFPDRAQIPVRWGGLGQTAPVQITVTFEDRCGKVLGERIVNWGEEIKDVPVPPEKSGLEFTGWSIPINDTRRPSFTTVAQYSELEVLSHNINIKDWNGTVLGTITINGDGTIEGIEIPVREGHTFTGWWTADTGGNRVIESDGSGGWRLAENVENWTNDKREFIGDGSGSLYAQYTINQYTVTFNNHDSTYLGTRTVDWGTVITDAPIATKEGHTFIGWSTPVNEVKSNFTTTAQFSINQHTVTFNDHDGSLLGTRTVDWGIAVTDAPVPTRDNHTFIGWSAAIDNVRSDFTVTAQYSMDIINHTVTFRAWCDILGNYKTIGTAIVANGGSVSSQDIPVVPEKAGHIFDTWNRSLGNITGDVTITALYLQVQVLVFIANPVSETEIEVVFNVPIEGLTEEDVNVEVNNEEVEVISVDGEDENWIIEIDAVLKVGDIVNISINDFGIYTTNGERVEVQVVGSKNVRYTIEKESETVIKVSFDTRLSVLNKNNIDVFINGSKVSIKSLILSNNNQSIGPMMMFIPFNDVEDDTESIYLIELYETLQSGDVVRVIVNSFGNYNMVTSFAEVKIGGGTISLQTVAGNDFANMVLEAYQIYELTGSQAMGFDYVIHDIFKDFEYNGLKGLSLAAYIYTIDDMEDYGDATRSFISALMEYIRENDIQPTREVMSSETSTSAIFTFMPRGYYLINGRVAVGEAKNVVPFTALANTDGANHPLRIDPKVSEKFIVKDLYNGRSEVVRVGDIVEKEIKTGVPENVLAFSNYVFKIHGIKEEGMQFEPDSLTVKVNPTLTEGVDYILHYPSQNAEYTYTIEFTQSFLRNNMGEEVIINYDVTVLESAVKLDGNNNILPMVNEAVLEYSTNPLNPAVTFMTVPCEGATVVLYTTDFKVYKFTGNLSSNHTVLGKDTGVKFGISDNNDDKALLLFVELEDGVYLLSERQEVIAGMTSELIPDDNGLIWIKGLCDSSVYLHEIEAPQGYTLLTEAQKVDITYIGDGLFEINPNTIVRINDIDENVVAIRNARESIFPETGGIGITIFLIIGGALMGLAIALYVYKRKKDKCKQG